MCESVRRQIWFEFPAKTRHKEANWNNFTFYSFSYAAVIQLLMVQSGMKNIFTFYGFTFAAVIQILMAQSGMKKHQFYCFIGTTCLLQGFFTEFNGKLCQV